jgi:aminopeptidase N
MTYYCQRYSGYAFAPGAQPQYLPDVDFKTVRVKIVLDIDPYNQVVDATCFTDLKSLSNSARNITFHARLMKIKGVRLDNGKKLKYLYDKKKIEIVLPRAVPVEKQITVAIDYRLEKPEIGLHFIKPDKNYPNRPYQVWTQGQPDDSRFWFPCLDVPFTKAVTETVMTVPDEFMAVSNGKLIEMKHDQQKKRRTFHWRMSVKHSLYLVCLAVGKFSEIKHGAYKGIPILYYCEKGREQDAMRGFGKTPDVIRFFSEKTGVDYPYEKYAQIAACEFGGGMENTSATIQTDVALIDKRAAREVDFDGLVAHEAAHQWFGDLVTCKDWSHVL